MTVRNFNNVRRTNLHLPVVELPRPHEEDIAAGEEEKVTLKLTKPMGFVFSEALYKKN